MTTKLLSPLRPQVQPVPTRRSHRSALLYHTYRRQLPPPRRASSASPTAASPCSPAIRAPERVLPSDCSPSGYAAPPRMSSSAPSSTPRAAPWTSTARASRRSLRRPASPRTTDGLVAQGPARALGRSRQLNPLQACPHRRRGAGDPHHRLQRAANPRQQGSRSPRQLLCVVFAGDARSTPRAAARRRLAPARLPHSQATHPRLRLTRRAPRLP